MLWSDAEEIFATTLPGYESRAAQQQLATAVEATLASGEVIAAQAGTGTGKSFAGLVPAIEAARTSGLPSVVATATKALQDQYMRDLAFLQSTLGETEPFSYTKLKGRSNYLCRAKLNSVQPHEVTGLGQLVEEIETGDHTGDLDDVVTELDPRDRPKITTSSDECPGKHDCPFGSVCFAEAAKQRAKESDVVVVNHALLVTDLQLKTMLRDGEGRPIGMLPQYGAVIVDEAHELEEYATGTLGQEFTQRGIQRLATQAGNFLDDPAKATSLTGAATALFDAFERLLRVAGPKERTTSVTDNDLLALENEFVGMVEGLRQLWLDVNAVSVRGDDDLALRQKRIKRLIQSAGEKFNAVIESDSTSIVRWAERDDKRGVIFKYAPLHVGPFLRANLWNGNENDDAIPGHPAVLLSATLSLGNDFSYITERLGIDSYRSFDAGTPFDFPKQSALYIPNDCEPAGKTRAKWEIRVQVETQRLVEAAGGRALLLFTSRTAMNKAYDTLAPVFRRQGLTVLKQGDRPNGVLTQQFKADETSVLFALRSFMTGIDVQGDALRLVVLDKLPFPVPSDVIFKARCDAVDAAAKNEWVDGSFPKLTVPMMSLVLMQAFGRLIRTRKDTGMVVIFDSRIRTKRYGKRILSALPPARLMAQLDEAVDYLEGLG